MGRKELSTLATRAKKLGQQQTRYEERKKERKNTKLQRKKIISKTTWSNNKKKRSSYDIAKFPLTNVLFAAVELHTVTGGQEICRVVYQKLSGATTKSRVHQQEDDEEEEKQLLRLH
jgi:hypothetical protein